MNLDPPRARLMALVAERKTDLATVSRAIPRNHAYLQQFVNRGTPRHLSEEVRECLGQYFGVDPDEFRARSSNRPLRSSREAEVLEHLRALPDSQQDLALALFEALVRALQTTETDNPGSRTGTAG